MASPRPAIPRAVWVLGFVSLLMDASSELIHALLPVFLVTTLGADLLAVGVLEGVAEATALIVKVFSGPLSDLLGRRKALAAAGYGLGALSKPFFAAATNVGTVFGARFADRVGKGIRGAPRDALVADVTPPEIRGAAFGLRQSLDTVGAFLGPLLGIALMLYYRGDFRSVFWLAAIPAVLSILLLVLGVSEPETSREGRPARLPIHRAALRRLGAPYWRVVGIGTLFGLARFSEAFLILRARQAGLADAFAPAVLVLMNVVYAATAYPAGRLADRLGYGGLLAAALAVLVGADAALANAGALPLAALGIALWGLHLGLSQGVLAAWVAETSPAELRGTAFGFFNLASGLAALGASVLAGALWDRLGAPAAFAAGAGLAGAALLFSVSLTPALSRRRQERE